MKRHFTCAMTALALTVLVPAGAIAQDAGPAAKRAEEHRSGGSARSVKGTVREIYVSTGPSGKDGAAPHVFELEVSDALASTDIKPGQLIYLRARLGPTGGLSLTPKKGDTVTASFDRERGGALDLVQPNAFTAAK